MADRPDFEIDGFQRSEGAHLGVTGELRHAGYIGHWLQLLKVDDRAIFTASSRASQAADYLRAFSESIEEDEPCATSQSMASRFCGAISFGCAESRRNKSGSRNPRPLNSSTTLGL